MDVLTSASEPALLIALSPAKFRISGKKIKAAQVNLEMGRARWLDAGRQETLDNSGGAPIEFLRFDFKTKPVKPDSTDKGKPHTHPH